MAIKEITLPSKKEILKAWTLATRPRTLFISLPPIIVSSALAKLHGEALNWWVILWALWVSLSIQIGTNLVNDALDFKKGADCEGRMGPLRLTQSGVATFTQVLSVGWLCYALAVFGGLPLIAIGGWPIFFVLLISILCGYLYTGGPFPLAYVGVSDLFVLLFFGWVNTCTFYYLQTHTLDFASFLGATQIGFLATVPLAINNLRDREGDARANKKTLAVRFGAQFARLEISFLSFTPFMLGLFWIQKGHIWMTLLPLLVWPLVIRNVKAIWAMPPSVLYNEFLGRSAFCAFIFSCLLALGALIL